MERVVYIQSLGAFLPNEPVDNEHIESVLGMIGGIPSRTRKIILRNNGIKTRYYAIDPQTGKPTHTNAKLAAEAVKLAIKNAKTDVNSIDLLCCGTSNPDQLMPNHAAMVHGELKIPPCEIVSTAGVCCSSIIALKYAWMALQTGQSQRAVAVGSDSPSLGLKASRFPDSKRFAELEKDASIGFEHDFLRWMLSDGAGAAVLGPERSPYGLSLRIDALHLWSYANELEPCMYCGASKNSDGSLTGWLQTENLEECINKNVFNVGQDSKLLDAQINKVVQLAFHAFRNRYQFDLKSVNWLLPHYSSEYFKKKMLLSFNELGLPIREEQCFTNLVYKGNTGAASIYIILEEFIASGRAKPGDKILCFIPESSRFSVAFMLLTVV